MVKNWSIIKIGDCLEFKNGLNKEKGFFGYGTPIINYMDVYRGGGIYARNIKGRVCLSKEEINRYKVKKGDVFFTRTSEMPEEVGYTNIMIDDIDECVFSGFVLRGRPKNDWLDINYCKYCFSTLEVRKSIILSCTYTTRALTNGKQLSAIEMPLPDKNEQKDIAEVLSDIDNLITYLEKLIDKKKAIKQGTMQALLTGKNRLLGFTENWVEKSIKQFGEIVTGGTPSTTEIKFWNGNITWVTPTDITTKRDIYMSERRLTEKGIQQIRILPANTVLVTCIASIGKNVILRTVGGCNQQINAIVPNDEMCVEFIYYLIDNESKYLLRNAGITATNIISKKFFEELVFKIPKYKEEQTEIAKILSDMDTEIGQLEKKLSKYQLIKQGMMQELLTGRIRLITKKKKLPLKGITNIMMTLLLFLL